MSDNQIVIRADDDSVITPLMDYITKQKAQLIQVMGNSLLSDEDRNAVVAAARLFQLDEVVDVLREAIEEQRENNGDARTTEPTRFTN
jgi:hypothetical protein